MPIHSDLGENWFAEQRALRETSEQEELDRQNEEARQNEESNKAFEYLTAEYQLAGKIADAITSNELSSNSTNIYTTDDLTYTIKQKYFPPATEHQVNCVLSALERDYTRVAKHINCPTPDYKITLWQSCTSYNKANGIYYSDNNIPKQASSSPQPYRTASSTNEKPYWIETHELITHNLSKRQW